MYHSPMLAARPSPSSPAPASVTDRREIRREVAEKSVVVVGRRGCCMSYVVKRLLIGHGVYPAVCEVGEDVTEAALVEELGGSGCGGGGGGGAVVFPAVFIGGRLVGSLDWLIAAHISGDLLPILKDAGALWL